MILDYLYSNTKIKDILSKDKITLSNSCDNFNTYLIAIDFLKSEKSIFVVLPNTILAEQYYLELINIVNSDDVLFYPADELLTSRIISESNDFKYERINTILSLLDDKKKIVVTNFAGAIRYIFDKKTYENNIVKLKTSLSYDIYELINYLRILGYKEEYTITKTGEFSHRGSILDIFPLNNSNPIRIDFFGDEIDKIKTFSIDTQRSIETIDEIDIYPVSEMLYSDNLSECASKKIRDLMLDDTVSNDDKVLLEKVALDIEQRQNLDLLMPYIKLFDTKLSTILDFKNERKIYYVDMYKINLEIERMNKDMELYQNSLASISKNYLDICEFLKLPNVVCEGVVRTKENTYDANVLDIPSFKANPKEITKEIKALYKSKYIIISITDNSKKKNLLELLKENGILAIDIKDFNNISKGKINLVSEYALSINDVSNDLIIYSEKTLFEIKYNKRNIKFKSIYKNTIKISKYDELKIGDYVVHYDYGIGKYLGLKTIDNKGLKRDYIHVMYAKGDSLYIPLEQINLIQKYSEFDTLSVKLNNLSSSEWSKAKMRVRNKIRDISSELIKLYSARSEAKGFKFSPDNEIQKALEDDFMYEETKDQAKAILDVKHDMESIRPMDRLVCGDVGYGKTEVALRAAFKAVLDCKQVAILAPTTILSRQHYYTFKSRMEKYGVNVELCNRFVPLKKQKEIIEGVKSGSVDVLIGTHKILSKDIIYKDLGLLIIDEEQRFGVTHKEKIKELKVNVDTITLSATPIPRTLQMSMSGIRDLSMIETPPRNRYPIQTYVLERNDVVIRDAIVREISRGGQVFYMYNKVDDIDIVAAHISALVPDARICIGHGKMKKEELENTLVKFIDHEYDVIVCTTIIETGLDIPDTNTIIIHDADHLGLSQLYQIRGRVGRSDKIAFAYLMFEPKKKLTDQAVKRLEALKEFSDLGSGFRIAMRDLSIRGAGDLLGAEQSGFIDSVGIDMYLKILEEEIHKDKEDKMDDSKEKDSSLSKVYSSRYIDTTYINNEDVRIEIHKKIDKIESMKDLSNLEEELVDRFGNYSLDLELYMQEKLFNNLIKKLDVIKVEDNFKEISLFISDEKTKTMDGTKLFLSSHDISDRIKLRYTNNMIQIIFNKIGFKDTSYFKILNKYLDGLVN